MLLTTEKKGEYSVLHHPQYTGYSKLCRQHFSYPSPALFSGFTLTGKIRGFNPINGPPEEMSSLSATENFKLNPKAIYQSPAGSCTRISSNFLPDVKKPPLLFAALNSSELVFYAPFGTKKETPVHSLGGAPQLECPDDISTYTDINSCSSFIAGGLNPGFDETEVVALTWEMFGATSDASPAQGINLIDDYTFDEGATIITYTATGTDGTTSSCTFTVTISDNQVPRLESIPADITVEAAAGACAATVYWIEPTATDNCTPPHLINKESTGSPGDEFPVGTTRVYYTAYDAMGNESQPGSFTITVKDAEPPVLSLPADVTVACGDPLPAPWETLQQLFSAGGSSTDNCTLDESSFRLLSETPSSTVCPYTLTRVYRIADTSGNTTTAEHRIFVEGEGEIIQPEEEVQLKSGMAETITATSTGNWNLPGIWDLGRIPLPDDVVVIANGVTVTVNTAEVCNTLNINGEGKLEIISGGSLDCNHNLNLTIPPNAELIINGGYFKTGASIQNDGTFHIIDGTADIGSVSGNELQTRSDAIFQIDNGELNISGRLVNSAGTAIINGGTINISTIGHANSGEASFDMSSTTNLTISGGLINIHRPNGSGYYDIYIVNAANKSITNSTFVMGGSSTDNGTVFKVNSPVVFYDYTIYSGKNISISVDGNDLAISNQLTLNDGIIDRATNNQNIIVTNTSTGALSNTSGYITGNLQRAIAGSGTATYLFPVGNGSNYTPLELTFNSLLNSGSITVSSTGNDHLNIGTSLLNQDKSVNNYWTVNNSGVSFSSVDGTFEFPSGLADGGDYLVGMYSGGSWSYPNTTSVSSTSVSFGGLGSLPGTATFALAECEPPDIPVSGGDQTECEQG
ncbi:MAG: HYR domain-containing protein, partial [Mariniphaga sp.]